MKRARGTSFQRCGAFMLLATGSACAAQDRRVVTEPHIPHACITLHAALALANGRLKGGDESKLDTARIQRALDGCPHGFAVELAPKAARSGFLIGPIRIPAGVTLLVDRDVTLMASRDSRLYDQRPGSCGVVNEEPPGCKAIITLAHAPHAAIMGDGTIDGRGEEKLLHGDASWWELAEQARAGGRQQVPRLIEADESDDFTVYRITLRNSPNFHIMFRDGHGFTAWNLKIDTPSTARNTDGVDPASATDITVTHSFIRTGDDNVAIKGGEGGVGYMTVSDNHFFSGHGMSVGSETFGGVHDILVQALSLDGSDNGIRIKSNSSRGGLVERVTYRDVCMRDVKWPIVLDTHYDNPGPQSNRYPVYRDIRLGDVRVFGGGHISLQGLDPQHRLSVTLDGVVLDDPKLYKFSSAHAAVAYGPGPVNFLLQGEDVTSSGIPGNGTLASCDTMFVSFGAHE